MKQVKIFFIYTFKLIEKNTKPLIVIGLILLLALFVVIKFQKNITFKPTVSEGVVGTFTEKDLPTVVTNIITKKLVELDKTGQPIPSVAKDWQVSNEGKTYTVNLNNNLTWGDGTKLRAPDIDLPIPGVQIKPIDDDTLEFQLTDIYSPFPTLLNKPLFKKGVEGKYVGLGPYKIERIKKDPLNQVFVTSIYLKSDQSDLPNIKVNFYENEKTAKNALRLGDVQSLLGVNDISDLQTEQTLGFLSRINYHQLVSIFYNTKDPILSDENFRLALSFAAPSVLKESEAITSIPPTSWAFSGEVKDYLENPTQHQSYIKKVKNGRDKPITLTVTTSLKNVGERVVETWNKLGIKSVLRIESGVPQNFQALLITQNIPSDPDQYSLWHSTQTGTNISNFSNPRVDKDLEDGRKELDLEKRKQKYKDFQKTLLDDAPATFLYFPKYNIVYMKKIEPELKKVLDLQLSNI
jgi:peptide/nickel transport system substrate-binding protein